MVRLVLGLLRRFFLSRRDLLLENLALRQQLLTLKRRNKKPRLSGLDRLFWIVAKRRKPLRNMAEEVGLGEQYATPYGLAASMHHGSFEGVAAQLRVEPDGITFGEPSADGWIDAALISGYIYLLQILETLNRAMHLGFKTQLAKAHDDLLRVWKDQKRTTG